MPLQMYLTLDKKNQHRDMRASITPLGSKNNSSTKLIDEVYEQTQALRDKKAQESNMEKVEQLNKFRKALDDFISLLSAANLVNRVAPRVFASNPRGFNACTPDATGLISESALRMTSRGPASQPPDNRKKLSELVTSNDVIITGFDPFVLYVLGLIPMSHHGATLVLRPEMLNEDSNTARGGVMLSDGMLEALRELLQYANIVFDERNAIIENVFADVNKSDLPTLLKRSFGRRSMGPGNSLAYCGPVLNEEISALVYDNYLEEWLSSFLNDSFILIRGGLQCIPFEKAESIYNLFAKKVENMLDDEITPSEEILEYEPVGRSLLECFPQGYSGPAPMSVSRFNFPVALSSLVPKYRRKLALMEKVTDIVRIWCSLACDTGLACLMPKESLNTEDMKKFTEQIEEFGQLIGVSHYEQAYISGMPINDLLIGVAQDETMPMISSMTK